VALCVPADGSCDWSCTWAGLRCGKFPAGTETVANLELDRAAICVAADTPRIEEEIILLGGEVCLAYECIRLVFVSIDFERWIEV
jgi:hypothetical protein